MTTFNKETFKTMIQDTNHLKDCVDLTYIMSNGDFDNEGDLYETLETYIHQEEIIYYSTAIEYLSNNDPSLGESMQLAIDYGFTCDNVTSETLATIHYQDTLQQELSGLDLSECFTD